MENKLNWTEFKTIIDAKKLFVQYIDVPSPSGLIGYGKYTIWANDGAIKYETQIIQDASTSDVIGLNTVTEEANQTDFEDNYKDDANAKISPDSESPLPTQELINIGKDKTCAGNEVACPDDSNTVLCSFNIAAGKKAIVSQVCLSSDTDTIIKVTVKDVLNNVKKRVHWFKNHHVDDRMNVICDNTGGGETMIVRLLIYQNSGGQIKCSGEMQARIIRG